MKHRNLRRGLLVGLLCVALATPASAKSSNYGPSTGKYVGALVGVLAGIAVVIVLVVTHKKKITGCVTTNDKGITMTTENDKQTYQLSGNTAGIKAGERVRVQGKKIKSSDKGGTPTWEVEKLDKDYGPCHP